MSRCAVPSARRTTGGTCPALAQHTARRPVRPGVPMRATATVDSAWSPSPSAVRSAASSASAGPASVANATERSTPRRWAMWAAAATSCPVTSPTTTVASPSGCTNASYQSPPTWTSGTAGRYRTSIVRPGIRGGGVSTESWRASDALRSRVITSAYRSTDDPSRRAWSTTESALGSAGPAGGSGAVVPPACTTDVTSSARWTTAVTRPAASSTGRFVVIHQRSAHPPSGPRRSYRCGPIISRRPVRATRSSDSTTRSTALPSGPWTGKTSR